ncbi:MAG: class I SAM-dependent methyltransferase [Spirulina sp. SIO3F2]|nr:class I SAM-dependent methyltransferase [Spirulina sp. SIO3F2]
MKPDDYLKWICSSQTDQELQGNYDQWASTYESDIAQFWETVPHTAATALSKFLPNKQASILDFGAGTGMVGVALAQLGFKHIIGLDISPGMLEQAQQKRVYQALVCGAIADENLESLGNITGVIATGVFAERHAGEAELKAVHTKLQPGGVFVFTVRQGFLAQLQPMLNQTVWTPLSSEVMQIYDDPMHLLAYRKTAQ